MKNAILVILICSYVAASNCGFAQAIPTNPYQRMGFIIGGSPHAPTSVSESERLKHYQVQFIPKDPYRVYHGQTNLLNGSVGIQFEGTVVSIGTNFVLLEGRYGAPMAYMVYPTIEKTLKQFLVKDFSKRVVVGQKFSWNDKLVAFVMTQQEVEKAYPALVKQGSLTLGCLDYGQIWKPEANAKVRDEPTTTAEPASTAVSEPVNPQMADAAQSDISPKSEAKQVPLIIAIIGKWKGVGAWNFEGMEFFKGGDMAYSDTAHFSLASKYRFLSPTQIRIDYPEYSGEPAHGKIYEVTIIGDVMKLDYAFAHGEHELRRVP